MSHELNEECGVVAVGGSEQAARIAIDALYELRHRGSNSWGLVSIDDSGVTSEIRRLGMVPRFEEFADDDKALLVSMVGRTAIAQVRYATVGGNDGHSQPVGANPSVAHNGTLSRTEELDRFLSDHHFSDTYLAQRNDSEKIGDAVGHLVGRENAQLPEAFMTVFPYLEGAASIVGIYRDDEGDITVAGERDRYGLRPLAFTRQNDGSIMIVSETCAFAALRNPNDVVEAREVRPGEMIAWTEADFTSRQLAKPSQKSCPFEKMYFSRPESRYNGIFIGTMRGRMGEQLAREHPITDDSTIVVGMPNSAIPAARAYAKFLGIPYLQLIEKADNARSFIAPTQNQRELLLDTNLVITPDRIRELLKLGRIRRVRLVDDSIVRGPSSRRAVQLVRSINNIYADMGIEIESVDFLSSSPPICYPDFSGISIPTQAELAAYRHTPEELRAIIGCQYLGYLSLSGLVQAIGQPADELNLSIFTGEYPYDIGEHDLNIDRSIALKRWGNLLWLPQPIQIMTIEEVA